VGQALYRKYRSKTLSELVGQEHITNTLASAIKSGRISHAYLFTGPRGVGKTSVARILAHEINQLPYSDDGHLDIIEIDAASNRRIDDIRDLREKVHIAPTSAKYKVYIIDEVHMLTGESFNALLKTLEEPPKHVVFILATTEAHKLPATIVSRTQRYGFRPVDLKKVADHLRHIADSEKITIDDDALTLLAEHGEGSFRDSISVLDQIANISNKQVTAEGVEATLGIASKTAISDLLSLLKNKEFSGLVSQLETLHNQGITAASLGPQLIRALTKEATSQPDFYEVIDQLIDLPRAYNPQIKLLTILAKHTLENTQTAPIVTAKSAPVVASTAKPVFETTKRTSTPIAPKQKANTPPVVAEPQKPSLNPISKMSPEQWGQILAEVKVHSTALQSILRQSSPVLDEKTQTLTLTFKHALHSRKIDDAKAKEILVNAMVKILDGAPIINTVVDASVEPLEVKTAPPAANLDSNAQAVADLMGGGEAISA
jgi:DNA polymerase-3 subunit gamma/tau